MTYLSYMSNFNQLYNVAKGIANFAKNEYGESFIGFYKLKKVLKDHLVELLMSKIQSDTDKIKTIYITYFILNREIQPQEIEKIINNLYVLVVDVYEDKNRIEVECGYCGGSAEEECDTCNGDGRIDCRYCDGDGEMECYDCSGNGTEECRWCSGSGTETETEEDDEGNEIEVEVSCSSCNGSGNEDCRSCGGEGTFECSDCDGRGTDTCGECGGYGQVPCGYCQDGYTESDEEYYNVEKRTIIMYGTNAEKYVGKVMSLEDYNEMEYDDEIFEYEFSLNSRYYQEEDGDYEDQRNIFKMEDDFVEISMFEKLENYRGLLNF